MPCKPTDRPSKRPEWTDSEWTLYLRRAFALAKADPQGFPHWLRDIAIDVDEAVLYPRVMEWFREEIRRWCNQHRSRGQQRTGNGDEASSMVRLFPNRALPLADKCATLAAIHDVVLSSGAPDAQRGLRGR